MMQECRLTKRQYRLNKLEIIPFLVYRVELEDAESKENQLFIHISHTEGTRLSGLTTGLTNYLFNKEVVNSQTASNLLLYPSQGAPTS